MSMAKQINLKLISGLDQVAMLKQFDSNLQLVYQASQMVLTAIKAIYNNQMIITSPPTRRDDTDRTCYLWRLKATTWMEQMVNQLVKLLAKHHINGIDQVSLVLPQTLLIYTAKIDDNFKAVKAAINAIYTAMTAAEYVL